MERLEEEIRGWQYGKALFLKGEAEGVREALLSWAEGAFEAVQGRARRRILMDWGVKCLAEDLERGKPFSVEFRYAGSIRFGASRTSVYMGGFYRVGGTVYLGALIARLQGWGDHYRLAYNALTRGHPKGGGIPPEDPALLARAVAFPRRAKLMERLDLRKRNLEVLKDLLPPHLAKPLAGAVRGRIRLRNLRIWEGVALYHEREDRWPYRETYWLVLEGRAYPLRGEAWELAKGVLRKRKGTPLERARMALTVAQLGEWAG